jgi:type VI secretion system secreted protein VgrG
MNLTGNLTLDGQNDPTSVWVFQVPTSLTTESTSTVQLINGASSCNVFWQVGSSATLGTGSTFLGTILAQASITITTSAVVHGRALARTGAVTLDGNTITTACLTSPLEAATPSPTPTPTPTPTPAATPSPTPGPTTTPPPTPGPTTTPPPTGTVSNGPADNSTLPPFALPIGLALGVLGLAALVAQRRTIRVRRRLT